MTLYNVHVYREMRLRFIGIEADTPQAAADIAHGSPTKDADDIDDRDGQDLSALVDTLGDEEYEDSKTIDFEAGRLLNAAPDLLAACQAALDPIARIRCAYPETQNKHAYDMAVKAETLIRDAIDKVNPPKAADYRRGVYWNIEQMPNGRWVLWDKKEGFMDAVQTFDTQDEAEGWAEAMDYEGAIRTEAGRTA